MPQVLVPLQAGDVRQSLAEGRPYQLVLLDGKMPDAEIAILTELAKGKSNDEIAKELWVTQQTVKFHLTNVYRKLGAKNRADAVRQAYQLGLIERPLGDE